MRWGDVNVRGWQDGGVDGRAVATNIPATLEGVGVLSVGRGAPAAVEWNQRGALVQRVAGSLAREGLSVVVDVSGATWWEASDFTGCDCVFVVVPATLRGLGGAVRWPRVARQGGADPVSVVKHEAVSSVGVKDVESVTSMPVVAEFTSEKKIAKEIEETGLRLCGRSSFARMVSELREIADGYIKNGMPSLPADQRAISSAQSRAARMGELAA